MKFIDKKCFFLLFVCLFWAIGLKSQEPKQTNISCKYYNTGLKEILIDLEKIYGLVFYYTDQQVKDVFLTITIKDKPVQEALEEIFSTTQLDFKIKDQKKIILKKKEGPLSSEKKNRFYISGYVKEVSGEKLIGAHILESKQRQGVISNNLGYYCIILNEDSIEIETSYVGHEPYITTFYLDRDTILNFILFNQEIGEVVIRSSKEENHESTQMSKLSLTNGHLQSLPSVFGEPDLIKTIQSLPGIQSGIEGEGYLYVRGGGPDQNLILLDHVPVFQSSHMLGLVPYFNSSVINHVDVLKGGFPARYGGRISSVVDIDLKNGSIQEYHGNINIDPLMSQLMLEGPIAKERTSFMVSGRRTYIDLIAQDYINSLISGAEYDYQVYDINAKINHKISERDNITLSFFKNRESAKYYTSFEFFDGTNEDKFDMCLDNLILSFKWNKLLSKNLHGNLQIYYNTTLNDIKNSEIISTNNNIQQNTTLNFISSIKNSSINFNFLYVPGNNHNIRFGLNNSYQQFNPASFNSYDLNNYSVQIADEAYTFSDNYNTYDVMAYIEDEYVFTDKLKTNTGINYSFYNVGSKNYNYIEPRISMRYLLFKNMGIKFSYSLMHQYIHFLVNLGYSFPLELWVPSTEEIEPTTSNQFAIGLSQIIKNQYEFSIEAYYKTMNNLISFEDGVNYNFVNIDWKENVISGKGRGYGLEVFIQKKQGSVKGWIGYTLSWTERQYDELNYGEWFPYKYDRRHDINCTLIKTFMKNFEFSASWVYGTGNAISIPLASFDTEYWGENTIYSERNSYRMKAYHRLDINIAHIRKKNRSIRKWSIGLYNAYNRMNPFFIRYNESENNFTQYSLLPIIPSISYNYKF